MVIFSEITENEFVTKRHPRAKAIISSILQHMRETVRDRM